MNDKGRRSSILKQKNPLTDNDQYDEAERQIRKVRFSRNFVKPFTTHKNTTVWDETYEEPIEISDTYSSPTSTPLVQLDIGAEEKEIEFNVNQEECRSPQMNLPEGLNTILSSVDMELTEPVPDFSSRERRKTILIPTDMDLTMGACVLQQTSSRRTILSSADMELTEGVPGGLFEKHWLVSDRRRTITRSEDMELTNAAIDLSPSDIYTEDDVFEYRQQEIPSKNAAIPSITEQNRKELQLGIVPGIDEDNAASKPLQQFHENTSRNIEIKLEDSKKQKVTILSDIRLAKPRQQVEQLQKDGRESESKAGVFSEPIRDLPETQNLQQASGSERLDHIEESEDEELGVPGDLLEKHRLISDRRKTITCSEDMELTNAAFDASPSMEDDVFEYRQQEIPSKNVDIPSITEQNRKPPVGILTRCNFEISGIVPAIDEDNAASKPLQQFHENTSRNFELNPEDSKKQKVTSLSDIRLTKPWQQGDQLQKDARESKAGVFSEPIRDLPETQNLHRSIRASGSEDIHKLEEVCSLSFQSCADDTQALINYDLSGTKAKGFPPELRSPSFLAAKNNSGVFPKIVVEECEPNTCTSQDTSGNLQIFKGICTETTQNLLEDTSFPSVSETNNAEMSNVELIADLSEGWDRESLAWLTERSCCEVYEQFMEDGKVYEEKLDELRAVLEDARKFNEEVMNLELVVREPTQDSVHEVKSVEEEVRDRAKFCEMNYKIISIEENIYTITTLNNIIVTFLVTIDDSNKGFVTKSEVSSRISDESDVLDKYVNSLFMERLEDTRIKSSLGEKYTILTLLDYIQTNHQSLDDFYKNLEVFHMKYGIVIRPDFKVVYLGASRRKKVLAEVIINGPHSDKFDISLNVQLGCLNESGIQRIANSCRKGLLFLGSFLEKLDDYFSDGKV